MLPEGNSLKRVGYKSLKGALLFLVLSGSTCDLSVTQALSATAALQLHHVAEPMGSLDLGL